MACSQERYEFWAYVVIAALRGRSGQLIGFAKVTRDLTERKRADAEHATSHLLIEAVKDYAIFMLDPAGNIVSWNTGAERIKGYTAEEIIGQHFSCFYTEKDRQQGMPQRGWNSLSSQVGARPKGGVFARTVRSFPGQCGHHVDARSFRHIIRFRQNHP